MKKLTDEIKLLYEYSIIAFDDRNVNILPQVDQIEERIDELSKELENRHIERVKNALKTLDERELDIISRRFGLNDYEIETQREIAKSLNISRSYVSRIEKRALTKLYLFLRN